MTGRKRSTANIGDASADSYGHHFNHWDGFEDTIGDYYVLDALSMTSHPNRGRGRKAPPANPTPDEIVKARHDAGLTQVQAANKIWGTERGWQFYEAGERRMHPAIWWCFLQRTKDLRKEK